MKTIIIFFTTLLVFANFLFANICFAQVCFSIPTNFNAGINPRSVVSADFNGDGKMDLATADENTNNTSGLLIVLLQG